jgi:hypothetical protein
MFRLGNMRKPDDSVDRSPMAQQKCAFDPKTFLTTGETGRKVVFFREGQRIYAQDDAPDALFVIQKGLVQLSVSLLPRSANRITPSCGFSLSSFAQPGAFLELKRQLFSFCLLLQPEMAIPACAVSQCDGGHGAAAECAQLLLQSAADRLYVFGARPQGNRNRLRCHGYSVTELAPPKLSNCGQSVPDSWPAQTSHGSFRRHERFGGGSVDSQNNPRK